MNAEARELSAMDKEPESAEAPSTFSDRHIGPRAAQLPRMLDTLGLRSLDELVEKTVPEAIRFRGSLDLPPALSEHQALAAALERAEQNETWRSYLGLGFYGTLTPPVVLRNVLENPGWYTQYTPYQAEISQGRLEALLNFQTVIAELCGLELANSSLLDEGSAAAEAMTLCARVTEGNRSKFFVCNSVHPPTLEVVRTRAEPLGIEIVQGSAAEFVPDDSFFGALVQFPATDGVVNDYRSLAEALHAKGAKLVVATDLLALTLLSPPGEWGADIAVGNSQRFGVPLGFGGPHAAFMATRNDFRREIPGRLVGVSRDKFGRPAYRLALQTREQHIRREKATSNICTAQVLLAIMASMYAVYHGPQGLKRIARQVHTRTRQLASALAAANIPLAHGSFFDTLRTKPLGVRAEEILRRAEAARINLRRYDDGSLGVSLDETVTEDDLVVLQEVFTGGKSAPSASVEPEGFGMLERSSAFLAHPAFNIYHSETEMLRYLHRLQAKDLSLTGSMIPLGSCTMKLNATAEMMPITWPALASVHPFAPESQTVGYRRLIRELEQMLCEITGLDAVSLQPNAGSQGEYAGLLAIRGYYQTRGENRTVCLIPQSAHGTNPASAVLAGMRVVAVRCDERGNIDIEDLRANAEKHASELAALMVTYPSTHGVFEEGITEICDIVHRYGGQVYMDGANLNAQVGLCRPGDFGVDVCHLNLHKTFCIPHGGGGPGVGPVAAKKHLAEYLPGHEFSGSERDRRGSAVCSAPFGSAAILPISWMYIRMMGADGLRRATEVAILNANYIAARLEPHFPVLYRGTQGMVAHECILDLRKFKRTIGIEVTDIAKRLMDYGFHAPTVSFPVVETLMVEPTESESKEELDRFCDAMIAIRQEIREIEEGRADAVNNVLKNAPHTAEVVTADHWDYPYSREKAAYPLPYLRENKYWPPVSRIDASYGDRNLFCTCG